MRRVEGSETLLLRSLLVPFGPCVFLLLTIYPTPFSNRSFVSVDWGTEEWTRELGFPIKEDWRPWLAGSRDEPKQTGMTAGYVTTYKAGDMDFTFLTVSGAGHLVPQHKPVQALAMLDRALNGKPF